MISTIIACIDLTETTLTYRFFLAFPPLICNSLLNCRSLD
jgi:hypothetical protein